MKEQKNMFEKEKNGLKRYSRKDKAKGTFNLIVQQLRLEDRESHCW